ncbi:MAG: hypothetical protein LQ340_000367 [Diploschistes diacapsis]|nr:MAG: hypothetical protein LQ340_000367 [Diploschistes diacapsis]
MPKRKVKKLENSWVDAGDEAEERDNLAVSPSSTAPGPTSPESPLRSIQEIPPKQINDAGASSFVMPKLDKETASPQKAPVSPQVRKRKKSAIQITQSAQEANESSSKSNWVDHAIKALESVLTWLLAVLGGALQMSKKPISYLLAAYIFIGLLVVTTNVLTSKLTMALSPVCRIPGASLVVPRLCESPVKLNLSGPNAPQPEFDELMHIQSRFEDLLAQTGDDYAIPAFMKQSQLAMRDVREVVRFSQLRSKHELVLEFNTFIDAASQASWDLETFNSHVGRTVDKVLLTARWTQRALDDIAGPNATQGTIGNIVSTMLAPFRPIKYTEDVVLDHYIKHSDAVQGEISDLLGEAQAVFFLLRSLEETLDAIHGIAVRDTQYAEASRDEVLALLWTKLGGNMKQMNKFDADLRTLKRIATYGQSAYTSIAAAVLKLQSMSAEIDQLKERLISVDPVLGRPQIPLSIHLENIQLGVQRLEEARAYTREKRVGYSREMMDIARGAHGIPGESLIHTPGRKDLPDR